ncbi:MAG: hypothetical protein IJH52_03110, partial [Oscillospiraceae bacterium]|nr:hypothetical protein [Oscillospiraceae bacterium]
HLKEEAKSRPISSECWIGTSLPRRAETQNPGQSYDYPGFLRIKNPRELSRGRRQHFRFGYFSLGSQLSSSPKIKSSRSRSSEYHFIARHSFLWIS